MYDQETKPTNVVTGMVTEVSCKSRPTEMRSLSVKLLNNFAN